MRKISAAVISSFVVVILCAVMAAGSLATPSVPSHITRYVAGADIVGEGRLRYLFMDIYDATLYAPKGRYVSGKPVALTLRYLRTISGKTIADRTIDEMRAQEKYDDVTLAAWHEQISRIFPDVGPGSVLTGIQRSNGETVFYNGTVKSGSIKDPRFAASFFDIWLHPDTSSPTLRRALLGLGS